MDIDSAGDAGGVLESALIDQRMRADRHKSNFEALKAQHILLQENYRSVRFEYENLTENYDRLHQKSQEIIQKLQSERDEKIIECEGLKKQTLNGVRLEQLRLQLAEEIEQPFRKRVDAAENEAEALKVEYNKLKYNYALLKSEHDTSQMRHQSVIQEVCSKYEIEIIALTEERKKLLSRQERDIPTDLQRIRQLEREKLELQQRVKSLIAENEQVHAEKDLVGEHSKENEQLQSRQLVELQALNKTVELERSSLASQVLSLQEEITKSYQEQNTLSEQLTQAQQQLTNSSRKMEEAELKYAAEISELKMNHIEHCRELEQEKERCVSNHKACQAQLEVLTQTVREQDTLLAEKEQQIEQRVQQAREKEWEKQMLLEKEKVELEESITEQQRVHAATTENYKVQIERLEADLSRIQTRKSELESELGLSNAREEDVTRQLQSLISEVQQLTAISKKHQNLVIQHKSLQHMECELRDSNVKHLETIHHLENDLGKSQQEKVQLEESHKMEMEKERQSWLAERSVLNRRIEECETQQCNLGKQLASSKKESKKIQKHYKKEVRDMKEALELQKAKEAQFTTEKEAIITSLNLEIQKLRNQCSQMQRRRKEFLFLLNHDPKNLMKVSDLADHQDQEWKTKQELEEVSQRIDELEASRNLQLHQQEALLSALANQHVSSTPSHSPSLSQT